MILDSLPPIVPSIGLGAPSRVSAAEISASAATTSAPSVAGVVTASTAATTTTAASVDDDVVAAVNPPPPYIRLGNRTILTSSTARSWSWKAFSSTARSDDVQFHHWVPSSVEYADYPYARFDVHLDPLIYSNDEYEQYLEMMDHFTMEEKEEEEGAKDGVVKKVDNGGEEKSRDLWMMLHNDDTRPQQPKPQKQQQKHLVHSKVYPWTKSETDALLDLARAYDLRWPVIIDKWKCQFANVPSCKLRQIEDLQYRYYQVGAILAARRAGEVLAKEMELVGGGGIQNNNINNINNKEDKEKKDSAVPPLAAVAGLSSTVQGGEGGGGGDDTMPTAMAAVVGATISNSSAAPAATTNNVDTTTTIQNASVSSATGIQQQASFDKELIEALRRTHQHVSLDPSLAPPLSLPATGTSTHRLRGNGGGGAAAAASGNFVKGAVFDLAAERARRAHLDRLWYRSKEEEMEEERLRAELRIVEAQLRKLKRSGKHLVPAGSASAAGNAAAVLHAGSANLAIPGGGLGGIGGEDVMPASSSSILPPPLSRTMMPPPPPSLSASSLLQSSHRTPLDPFSNTHQSVSASFVETAPVPTPGTPYLQSGRLFPPSVKGHSGLNPNTLKQMNAILRELNVPEEPIPTKRNCDLYDGVRKDALTLLILQKIALRKEGELESKRSMLCEIKSAAAAVAAASAVSAAAAVAAAEETETTTKKNSSENGVEKKEGGSEVEGGKGKKGAAKRAKAKRPRADSADSNQGGDSTTTTTTVKAKGVGGKRSGRTSKKEGSTPKKRSRTKAKKDATPATTEAAAAPAASSNAPTALASSVPPATNVASLPPPHTVALPSASMSPIMTTGRSSHPIITNDPLSMLPSSLPPPTEGNNIGTVGIATIDPSSATPSTTNVIHQKTTNKPAKIPRGRNKG